MSEATTQSALAEAISVLRNAGLDNPQLEAELLMARACLTDRPSVIAHPERALSDDEQARFDRLVWRRAKRCPLAYLLGRQEFWGMELEVTPVVMVPRQETETLVEAALGFLRPLASAHVRDPDSQLSTLNSQLVADVGVGSGAIAVALARELPDARVYATDISVQALVLARRNARRMGVADRVRIISGDLLHPLLAMGLEGRLDAVCSNPPYIPTAELRRLQPEVAKHEPRIALDGGPDGLTIYRRLLSQTVLALRRGGRAFFEVGDGQAARVAELTEQAGLKVMETRRDLQGIDRVVIAERER